MKKILIVVPLLLISIFMFTACNNGVRLGKYVSEDDPESYFEIKRNSMIRVVNVDFSILVNELSVMGFDIDVYEIFQEDRPFDVNQNGDRIMISLDANSAITVGHNRQKREIVYSGITYRHQRRT